ENIQWVLLAGDAQSNLIPIREVYNPDVIYVPETSECCGINNYYKPTDFYYADLTGTWDSDGNDIWGESAAYNAYGMDEISWTPDVYVGRFPASDANELEEMVNKTLKYEKNPNIGNWMNRMLLAGAISSYYGYPDTTDEDEARLTEYIWSNYVLDEMTFTHLHKTTGSFTPISPNPPNSEAVLDNNNFDINFDSGYSTVMFAGHGDPTRMVSVGISGSVYDSTDASTSSNINMPSLFYGDSCYSSSYDIYDNTIGELLIKRSNAGAIGFIGALRASWYFPDDEDLKYLNRANTKLFWKAFFEEKKYQQGRTLYDSKVAYMNSDIFTSSYTMRYEPERKNVLTYNLLGDPEVDIYTDKPLNVTNPFIETIYEGQLVSITILNNQSKLVPYARVHLETADGKYYTVYADKNGIAKFRLPAQANETYYVTITGHNLIPSYFNFTTLPDSSKPQLIGLKCIPENPTTSKIITFNIEAHDNRSGMESSYIILSKNNFTDSIYFGLSNNFEESSEIFSINADRLTPGEYSYIIVIRDYANNTNIYYNSSFELTIPTPIIDYVLIISVVLIIGVGGISVFVLFKELNKYSHIVREI
ncbi:MAG: C25 family cysteine peptidase, partial [Candidatus Hodarchaeota archaeon]